MPRAGKTKKDFRLAGAAAFAARPTLRVGFVPLIDAAPLIAAAELGLFAEEGLDVQLHRQIGWGNVRDKLTFGQLDAAHTLIGMPLSSAMRVDRFVQPLVVLMNLGSGGDAISVSKRLADRGVCSAETLAAYISRLPSDQRLIFSHVFCCSMHHYLLREWLSSGRIDPDADVSLGILPPQQMASHMAHGYVDGFCVGEPYNTVAAERKAGRIVAETTDILPAHPEKALVVTRPWLAGNAAVVPALLRAILRGCIFCDEEGNWPKLARMLSRPQYLNLETAIILHSLRLTDAAGHRVRSMAADHTFPSGTHHLWLLREMVRWKHVTAPVDSLAIARRCTDATGYRAVARELKMDCPSDDFPDMPGPGGRLSASELSESIEHLRRAQHCDAAATRSNPTIQTLAGVSS